MVTEQEYGLDIGEYKRLFKSESFIFIMKYSTPVPPFSPFFPSYFPREAWAPTLVLIISDIIDHPRLYDCRSPSY